MNVLVPQMRLSMALNNRKIYLYDEISENPIFECIYYLNKLMSIDSISHDKKPIEILVNSNGGSVYDCLTLVSMVENMKKNGYEIITTNIGRAFSAGFIISIIGTKRNAYKYSTYLTHDVSSYMYGKAQELKECLDEVIRLRSLMNDIIIEHTAIPIHDLEQWNEYKIDKIFDANEALKLKIADEII